MTAKTEHNNTKTASQRPTHVIFVDNDPQYDKPIFCMSVKEATDKGTEIIMANPKATCGIYQLRTDMKGEIKIQREDFSN